MSRRERSKREAAKKLPDQLEDLAFNTHGYALEDGMLGRSKYETILAYAKSTTPYHEAIKKMRRDEIDNIFRTGATYTLRELGPLEPGLYQYLVVGYVPQDLPAEYRKLLGQKQRPVGIKRPDSVIAWEEDKLPLIVVTEVLISNQREYNFGRYWGQTMVFAHHTISNWNKLVAAQSVRASDTVLNIKDEKFRRAHDTTRVVLEPNQSLANEVLCLSLGFKRSKDIWFLKELQNVFSEIDADLNYRPPPRNTGLRKFIEAAEGFNEEDAKAVVKEIGEQ
ncbi:hypothetical protein GP486_003499 [Trichoglossum hirsutum]|uniref:Uncharacterized protein n=1 Tax=Trichoglossum hirsutum TaxID=265104 RepID=A0A9P8LCY4_9PEZI|nr:hypothetical protein GP486_003499 [Trichoglossum hirsutum]